MFTLWGGEPSDDKPDEHSVEVKIDDDETIIFLKKLIQDGHAPMLNKVPTHNLVLWKCSIPADDNLQETLKTIRFDIPDTRLHRLPPVSLLLQLVCLWKPSTSLLRYPRLVSVAPVSPVQ